MKFKHNYGSEVLNNAYENFYKGEHISYEEFVIMLSTNDELYFSFVNFSQNICQPQIIITIFGALKTLKYEKTIFTQHFG